MNTALLVGIFTTLVFLGSELPPPDATVDAETRVNPGPRTTAITDSSNIGGPITGQDTSPAMSYAADSPKPLGSPADGAKVVVDAASTRFDVNKSNFGDKYLTTTTTSPRYIIPSFRTDAPLYETPYISAYATLAQNNSTVKIIVINRSADTATGTSKFIYPGVRGRLYLTVTAIKPDGNPGAPSNMIAVDMP